MKESYLDKMLLICISSNGFSNICSKALPGKVQNEED
jgi:hypothetical protein